MLLASSVVVAASPPNWTVSDIDGIDVSTAQPAVYTAGQTGGGFARIDLNPALDEPIVWQQHGDGYVAILTVCCNFQNLSFQSRWLLTIDPHFAASVSEIRIQGMVNTLSGQPTNTVSATTDSWPVSGLWSPTLSTPNPGAPATLVLLADEIPDSGELVIRSRRITEGLADLGGLCLESATCEIDRQQGARLSGYTTYSRSVALLRFYAAREDVWATCTGTLIRDAQQSGRKFMLTASHCIRDQEYADSLEIVWFFTERQSQRCTGLVSDLSPRVTIGGADILASQPDDGLDWVLLEIRGAIPDEAYFMNWDITPVSSGEEVLTIGHSLAGVQSFAVGTTGDAGSGDLAEYRQTNFTTSGILPGASGSTVVTIDGTKIRIAALSDTPARGGTVQMNCPLGTVDMVRSISGVTMTSVYAEAKQWLDPQGLRSGQATIPPPTVSPPSPSSGGGGISGVALVLALSLLFAGRRVRTRLHGGS